MLNLVHPSQLRKVWPIIRCGLEDVARKNEVDWIPEDVYHSVKSGVAAVHLAESGSFLVTCLNRNQYTNDPELHIWIARNVGGSDVITEGLELLRAMATNAGARRITFDSPRNGWERRYNRITAVYEVPL